MNSAYGKASRQATSNNGTSYTYGSQPHAVTAVGDTSYEYDDNGNMTVRGNQALTWDVENRPVSVTDGVNTTTFVYDGNGNRVEKTEGGETVLYVNKYYEKNLTTSEVTTSYYLGDKLVAQRKGTTLSYIHQDNLNSTSVISDTSGNTVESIKYYPYGECRNSPPYPTDKLFTGQRLDSTGLYYYNARYYDPTIGRFISADTIVQNYNNPQCLNRYSYVLNNPLRYNDPTGRVGWGLDTPTANGQLGWTSENGWTISYQGKRYPISVAAANLVVLANAQLAGIKRVDVIGPNFLSTLPDPVDISGVVLLVTVEQGSLYDYVGLYDFGSFEFGATSRGYDTVFTHPDMNMQIDTNNKDLLEELFHMWDRRNHPGYDLRYSLDLPPLVVPLVTSLFR